VPWGSRTQSSRVGHAAGGACRAEITVKSPHAYSTVCRAAALSVAGAINLTDAQSGGRDRRRCVFLPVWDASVARGRRVVMGASRESGLYRARDLTSGRASSAGDIERWSTARGGRWRDRRHRDSRGPPAPGTGREGYPPALRIDPAQCFAQRGQLWDAVPADMGTRLWDASLAARCVLIGSSSWRRRSLRSRFGVRNMCGSRISALDQIYRYGWGWKAQLITP
jgi:hypothetical protein